MAKKKSQGKGQKKKLGKGWKILIGVLTVLAAGANVFVGCYFGIPKFHDLVNKVPEAAEGAETAARLLI